MGKSPQKEQIAIHHQNILRLRAAAERESDPIRWAVIKNDLGLECDAVGTLTEDPGYLQESINVYRDALQIRTLQNDPTGWAQTKYNLGSPLRKLGCLKQDPRLLQESVDEYRDALQVRTRERNQTGWVRTKNNLGLSFARLAQITSTRDPAQRIAHAQESLSVYHEALQVRTRKNDLGEWSVIQQNLASPLKLLGLLKRDPAYLNDGIAICRKTLNVLTGKSYQNRCVSMKHTLGSLLSDLGFMTKNPRLLQESVNAYREVLQVRTPEGDPNGCAQTQYALGYSLGNLGFLTNNQTQKISYLEESVNVSRAALQVYTREKNPNTWSHMQESLGFSLGLLGSLKKNPDLLQKSVDASNAAMQVYTRETGIEWIWQERQGRREAVLAELASLQGNRAHLQPSFAQGAWNHDADFGHASSSTRTQSDILEQLPGSYGVNLGNSTMEDSQEWKTSLAHIERSPQLKQYRDHFKRAAYSLLHSASALRPQPGRSDVQVGVGTSKGARFLNVFGKTATAVGGAFPVPALPALGTTIQYVGNAMSAREFNKINSHLSSLVEPHEINAFCDSIANSAALLNEGRLRGWNSSPSIQRSINETLTYYKSRVDGTAGQSKAETLEEKCATNDACSLLIDLSDPQFKGLGFYTDIPFKQEPLSEKIDIAMQHFCRKQNEHPAWRRSGVPSLEADPRLIVKRIPSRDQLNAVQETVGVHGNRLDEHRDDMRKIAKHIQEEKGKRKTFQKDLLRQLADLELSDTESEVTEIFAQRRSERGTRASAYGEQGAPGTSRQAMDRSRGGRF